MSYCPRKAFLEGLAKLTKKTGYAIKGCGCCGSPYLTKIKTSSEGGYTIRSSDENVEYVDPVADEYDWNEYKSSNQELFK